MMNFHEKSAWACLLSIVVIYGPYFLLVFRYPMAYIGLFGLAVIALAVLLAVFHIINAIVTPSIRNKGDMPAQDELDRMIEMRAAKLSGIVLSVAVMVWCLIAMFVLPTLGISEQAATFAIPVIQALTGIQLLFAGFVVANLVYYGTIVASYRSVSYG